MEVQCREYTQTIRNQLPEFIRQYQDVLIELDQAGTEFAEFIDEQKAQTPTALERMRALSNEEKADLLRKWKPEFLQEQGEKLLRQWDRLPEQIWKEEEDVRNTVAKLATMAQSFLDADRLSREMSMTWDSSFFTLDSTRILQQLNRSSQYIWDENLGIQNDVHNIRKLAQHYLNAETKQTMLLTQWDYKDSLRKNHVQFLKTIMK